MLNGNESSKPHFSRSMFNFRGVELEKWGMNIQVKEELALLQFFKQIVQLHVAHN